MNQNQKFNNAPVKVKVCCLFFLLPQDDWSRGQIDFLADFVDQHIVGTSRRHRHCEVERETDFDDIWRNFFLATGDRDEINQIVIKENQSHSQYPHLTPSLLLSLGSEIQNKQGKVVLQTRWVKHDGHVSGRRLDYLVFSQVTSVVLYLEVCVLPVHSK